MIEFNLEKHLESHIRQFITDRTFCTHLQNWLTSSHVLDRRLPKRNGTPVIWNLMCNVFRVGEEAWFFIGKDFGVYMFGDMYGINDELKAFLTELNLLQHTCFYEWKKSCHQTYVTIHKQKLNFHRSHVWVTRVPREVWEKSPNHKRHMGLLRCVPMLMLWRKRAAEYCFHPSRINFSEIS